MPPVDLIDEMTGLGKTVIPAIESDSDSGH